MVSEKPAFADQQDAGPLLLGLRRTADDKLSVRPVRRRRPPLDAAAA